MTDLHLSKHFMLSDFLKSRVAQKKGINNYPSMQVICNLQQTCLNVLEPVAEHFDATVKVLAGYQCPDIIRELELPLNSRHLYGEAVDFIVELPGVKDQLESLLAVYGWMCDNCPYDELYLEYVILPEKTLRQHFSRAQAKYPVVPYHFFWIHVSYRSDESNCHQRRCPVPL